MILLLVSNLSYFLFALVIAAFGFIKCRRSRDPLRPPGPFKWPVIGNLHLLRGFAVPYQAFDHLAKIYGSVYSLQMGSVPAVVVQGVDNIKQVLVRKGNHFDSRPDFNRYHQLFHGNKENSLAFCNWSDLQKKRRDMLKDHTFPKVYTNNFKELDRLIAEEFRHLFREIADEANNNNLEGSVAKILAPEEESLPKALRRLMENKHVETIIRFPHYFNRSRSASVPVPSSAVELKEKLSRATANVFLRYFCSTDLGRDDEFRDFVRNFDEIFYEVNQGYAFDFLPFLGIFHRNQIRRVQKNSGDIRDFVLRRVIGDRMRDISEGDVEKDYLDGLLKSVKFGTGDKVAIDLETALFSLEDILGGHSAISNFLVKLVQFLVKNPSVQTRIRQEAEQLQKEFITLEDRVRMPFTEGVVMETLRLLSSPIVPHVANRDTSISGYVIEKGTLIFLNNYELNMSEKLWSNPEKFDPSRFIDPETGFRTKPGHFLPFGGGKRSCMGYKLVQFLSFVFLANLVNNFDVSPSGESDLDISTGTLALPPTKSYKFEFRVR